MTGTDINKAVRELQQGGVVGLPTETVYGLAANIYDEQAVQRIFRLKSRPHSNPLIVHIGSMHQLQEVTRNVPEIAERLAAAYWPGGLTLLLPKHPDVPALITAGKDRVAVRIPDHPLTLQLLAQCGFPLAAPSANPFGCISPTTAAHVSRYFGEQVPYILDGGPCSKGLESTIIGFEQEAPIVYRLGAIPIEKIEKITGKINFPAVSGKDPEAPGMMSRHYAPATRLILTENISRALDNYSGLHTGVLVFNEPVSDARIVQQQVLSPSGDLEEAAANLFSTLHTMDTRGLDLIIALRFPDHGLGRTINDRLQRAAHRA